MCRVEVRSPVVLRRHFVRLGTGTPQRLSMNRSCEVWSKTSDAMWPPVANGDSTSAGTRKPSPIGPSMPPACHGKRLTERDSCLALRGGAGGAGGAEEAAVFSYL